ncbi:zinc finger domain-containing protein [Streptomyces griseosporeus]|uniref:zinc finger domain-containing protein n=1 Tax=Streptomyces griseosporeus TaxID=1910 RepID=UPI0036867292
MTQEPFNALQFARDLEKLRADLEHAANEYMPIEHQSASAAGFLIVINELTAGTDPTTAVARAMAAYNRVRTEQQDHERATREQQERDEAELAAEEEITRKVACPYCDAQAGLSCVGTGRSGGIRKKSHADRIRLARRLNDGHAAAEPEGGGVR